MNKTTKVIYRLHNLLIGLLLLALIGGTVIWLIMGARAEKERQQVQQAIMLVKEKINYQPADYFGGCVYPDNGVVIVTLNHISFLGVKSGQVFIPELARLDIESSKSYGPTLPIEAHDINPYYLYEYCR